MGLLRASMVCALCGIGAWLLRENLEPRSTSYADMHIQVIQRQLDDLAGLPRDYHQQNGRYPSNDEGLTGLPFATTVDGWQEDRERHRWKSKADGCEETVSVNWWAGSPDKLH